MTQNSKPFKAGKSTIVNEKKKIEQYLMVQKKKIT